MAPCATAQRDHRGTTRGGAGRLRAGLLLLALASLAAPAAAKQPAQEGGVLAFGLRHTPLGAARLAGDGQGNLVVSGLGAGGEDGVAVDLGTAEAWDADWLDLDPRGTVPDGASLTLSFEGRVDGAPGRPIAALRVEDIGEVLEISVDFSALGATSSVIEVRDGGPEGLVVAHVDGGTGPIVRGILWPFYGHIGALPGGGIAIDFGWRGFKKKMAIVGGPTVEGDYLCVMPADAAARAGALSRVEIRTSDIPELTLTGESLTLFGLRHRAAEGTTLDAAKGGLSLLPDASGEMAVEVDVHGRGGWDAVWSRVKEKDLPDGAALRTVASGTVDGVAGRVIGSTWLGKVGDRIELETSFAPLGAKSLRYDFLHDGQVVDTETGQSPGQRLALNGKPTITRDAHYSIIGTGEPCFTPGYPCLFAGYTFGNIGFLSTARGIRFDEIRVYPEGVEVRAVTALDRIRLGTAGFPGLTLVDEGAPALP